MPTNDEKIIVIDPEAEYVNTRSEQVRDGEGINSPKVTNIIEFAKRCKNA